MRNLLILLSLSIFITACSPSNSGPTATPLMSVEESFAKWDSLDNQAKEALFVQLESEGQTETSKQVVQDKLLEIFINPEANEVWRERSRNVLVGIEDRDFTQDFFDVLKARSTSRGMKINLITSVAKAAGENEEILLYMVAVLDDSKQSEVHGNLINGLRGLKDERILPALVKTYTNSEDKLVRMNAATALVTFLGEPLADDTLDKAIKDEDQAVRLGLVAEFTNRAEKPSIGWLEKMSQDPDPTVANSAKNGLKEVQEWVNQES